MHFSSFILACLAAGYASALSGKSTFYGGNVNGGTCSFSTYTLPSGIDGTAISQQNWAGSGVCGGCIEVTGPNGNKIKAMIVDKCPEGGTNSLDLFQTAFVKLADVSKGIIDVTWDYVPCGITTPLQIHMKEGVSAFWFSAQAVNANKRVKDLQVSTDGGSTWKSGLTRMDYNFFQQSSGFGVTTVAVKVISVDDDEVVVKNVEVVGGKLVTAESNFPSDSQA